VNPAFEDWLRTARHNPVVEAWSRLDDGNKLLALLILLGLLVHSTAKSDGVGALPLLVVAFGILAYALLIALRMF
jgi:hypothetical protein